MIWVSSRKSFEGSRTAPYYSWPCRASHCAGAEAEAVGHGIEHKLLRKETKPKEDAMGDCLCCGCFLVSLFYASESCQAPSESEATYLELQIEDGFEDFRQGLWEPRS